jgi:hypothetical protein
LASTASFFIEHDRGGNQPHAITTVAKYCKMRMSITPLATEPACGERAKRLASITGCGAQPRQLEAPSARTRQQEAKQATTVTWCDHLDASRRRSARQSRAIRPQTRKLADEPARIAPLSGSPRG